MEPHHTRSLTHRLLAPLRESIIDKPPFISGTLQLPQSYFSLLYRLTKDGLAARFVNFSNVAPEELEQLTQACEPASFGMNQENVLDEAYRKAGKMDSDRFAPMLDLFKTDLIKIIRGYLLEGTQSRRAIKTELYKLNVYGEGSFFKPHVDTPHSKKMFGSLVIVFPTPHEGGALLLRHRGHEWIFDSGQELAAELQPSIGYVAFFSDIEHEVAPVTSGHRITLTYNLYFDDGGPVSANDAVSEHLTPLQIPNEGAFRDAFKLLLENPEFMADGGALAFGLRHVYQIENDLKHVHSILKANDAVVYQSVRALGYEPVLYVYYKARSQSLIIDKVIDLDEVELESERDDLVDILLREGGIVVSREGEEIENDPRIGVPEQLEWVTPVTEFNRQIDAFPSYGNEPTLNWVYGDVCLVVRIGKAGDRLAYPTVTELDKASQRSRERRR